MQQLIYTTCKSPAAGADSICGLRMAYPVAPGPNGRDVVRVEKRYDERLVDVTARWICRHGQM